MKLAKNHTKIDKSPPLSVEMAAIHTTSSLDKEILQKSSFEELGYSSEHKYFTLDCDSVIVLSTQIMLLLVSCFKNPPFKCCYLAVCTKMSLLILLSPNISLFMCRNVETEPFLAQVV